MEPPRITAAMLRQATATRDGVVVQSATTGIVWAQPQGLTKPQLTDPSIVVILTNGEAAYYVTGAAGSYAAAARSATTVLAWEMETIEARLTAAATR